MLGCCFYENVYSMVGDEELGCFSQFFWLVAKQNTPTVSVTHYRAAKRDF